MLLKLKKIKKMESYQSLLVMCVCVCVCVCVSVCGVEVGECV